MRTEFEAGHPGGAVPMADTPLTAVAGIEATAAGSAWRRMRVWAAAHAIDDLYQGLVPASVPYFVLDRHYGYVAASGLTLAATLGGSLPQPLVGLLVDRRRVGWLAAAGVSLAGIGAGLAGVLPTYALSWLALLLSGVGVSMFHPAAGKAARRAAGDQAAAMSVFAAGGSVGFFLAPVLATPLLAAWGLAATAVFIPPAVLIGYVLLRAHQRQAAAPAGPVAVAGTDRWHPFLVLTGVEVIRSVVLFGVSTFIELYWIRHLHAGHTAAGAALACFMVGGVAGTLTGGRVADAIGAVRAVQAGTVLLVPMLVLLRLAPSSGTGLVAAVATGLALNIPFAVLVKLGQDYLPTRPGTASGVTLGLAVSAGGLCAPVWGAVADAHGIAAAFTVLCFVPLLSLVLVTFLPEP
ncbi:major facilitator superfamily MFS_1 [Pseudofrankia inefficax]|uniref:Major facilitator superfamily MFS_1 n=2 Tax=Pseudofrankia inefficax (strain DSM 45817 / CECT 9037 / DDB 130130 / EuI1c) TaxID=298654 RepID=E3IUC6_PSEI1|nr:MFS transporter [Pseudofrankia inefficax]ADP82463.1 major facilitator superfamily MFS_1 [Pseudofrankia inefficax]